MRTHGPWGNRKQCRMHIARTHATRNGAPAQNERPTDPPMILERSLSCAREYSRLFDGQEGAITATCDAQKSGPVSRARKEPWDEGE